MDKKKELQKVVGLIRADIRVEDNNPSTTYPKAMMTSQQMGHNTATVNCGGAYGGGGQYTRKKALRVLRDERFIKYLDAFKAKAEVEQIFEGGNTGFQVRIRYAE